MDGWGGGEEERFSPKIIIPRTWEITLIHIWNNVFGIYRIISPLSWEHGLGRELFFSFLLPFLLEAQKVRGNPRTTWIVPTWSPSMKTRGRNERRRRSVNRRRKRRRPLRENGKRKSSRSVQHPAVKRDMFGTIMFGGSEISRFGED